MEQTHNKVKSKVKRIKKCSLSKKS